MKRNTAVLGLFALLALLISPWLVQAQVPSQRVIITDPTGMHAATVTGGAISTSASVTVDAISHISSAIHVAGIAQTVAVDCVSGCSASAGTTSSVHVAVALHVAGTINGARFHIQGVGIPGQAHGGVLTIQGVAGGVAVPISGTISTDTVNVFHQSTIRHISGSVHIAGTIGGAQFHIQGLGIPGAAHGGVLTIQGVAGGVAVPVSGNFSTTTETVNVFHQSTIRHISSVTHVAISSFSREAHLAVAQSGSWTMSATQASGHHFAVTMPQHVAVTFAGGGHVAITQAASLAVSCSNCTGGSGDAVNVFHQSTIRHISGSVHIAGTINGAQFHVQGLGIPGQAHGGVLTVQGVTGGVNLNVNCAAGCSASSGDAVNVFHQSTIRHISSVTHVYVVDLPRSAHVAAAQSGTWNVTAHQGGTWTVAHVSSLTHIGGSLQVQDMTCTTCRARVDHYNSLVVQAHISGAFRAFRVASCGTTATQFVATNLNRRTLMIQNLGGPSVSGTAHSNVALGFGVTGHVALTMNNGWILHAMTYVGGVSGAGTGPGVTGPTAMLTLENYAGPVSCISATTGPLGATLGVLEILR